MVPLTSGTHKNEKYFLPHDYLSYKFTRFFIYFLFLSDEGPTLETLDYTIRIGSTPTFLYFDLYLYSAYAAHYVCVSWGRSIGLLPNHARASIFRLFPINFSHQFFNCATDLLANQWAIMNPAFRLPQVLAVLLSFTICSLTTRVRCLIFNYRSDLQLFVFRLFQVSSRAGLLSQWNERNVEAKVFQCISGKVRRLEVQRIRSLESFRTLNVAREEDFPRIIETVFDSSNVNN